MVETMLLVAFFTATMWVGPILDADASSATC